MGVDTPFVLTYRSLTMCEPFVAGRDGARCAQVEGLVRDNRVELACLGVQHGLGAVDVRAPAQHRRCVGPLGE
jgi:hypothetical protein